MNEQASGQALHQAPAQPGKRIADAVNGRKAPNRTNRNGPGTECAAGLPEFIRPAVH